MRIAMFGHKYVPSREGGVEIVVENLATRLVSLGHDVTLYNRKRKEYKSINEFKGCKIESVYTINKRNLDAIVYSFFACQKAKKLIKKKAVDVVHFHAEGPCFFLNLLPHRKKRPNTKIVVTIHGLDWQRGKWSGFGSKVLKKCEKKIVKYADEIIVLSKNVQNYFKETYGRETFFIPNGVEIQPYESPDIISKKYGLQKDDYLLFLARIVPEKGLHYLIDAWKRIDESIKKGKKLVVAGGSSHSNEYYNSIVESVKNRDDILMTGFVEGRTLQELFSNAFVYVLPSDLEGMPMSLLEALSYKRVCLVSDIDENRIDEENSYFFKHSNVDSLIEKLIEVLENRKTFKPNNSLSDWNDVVKKTLLVYGK